MNMSEDRATAIIYGLGKKYRSNFFVDYLLPFIEERYQIIGLCDTNENAYLENDRYPFIEKSFELNKADTIIVTSTLFFQSIKHELFEKYGISKIISLDVIEKTLIDEKFHAEKIRGLLGVEIGGPSYIFRYIYEEISKCDGVNYSTETVWWKDGGKGYQYNQKKLGELIIADAVDLRVIRDKTYDFCLSSNNLEHIANPLKAISEFIRILKNEGVIVIVVPRKEDCFDHRRKITSFEHLLEDYENNTDEHDLTHLEEITMLHDCEMDPGIDSIEQFKERAKNNYMNRCLHHHVFDDRLLERIFNYFGIEVTGKGRIFNNYFITGIVEK